MARATISQFRHLIRTLNYVVSTHAAEELEDDNLSILDLENIILTGQVTERQRDTQPSSKRLKATTRRACPTCRDAWQPARRSPKSNLKSGRPSSFTSKVCAKTACLCRLRRAKSSTSKWPHDGSFEAIAPAPPTPVNELLDRYRLADMAAIQGRIGARMDTP
jgi:hypothetical protein